VYDGSMDARSIRWTLALLAWCTTAFALGEPPVPPAALQAAKKSAAKMQEAARRGDWAKVLEYTYPTLVERMGGKEKALAFMKKQAGGIKLRSVKLGEPTQAARVGDKTIQVTLPTQVRMAGPISEAEIESTLLGVSRDGGKTWTFVDVQNPEQVRAVVPDVSPELKLVSRGKPKMTKPAPGN